MKTPVGLTQLDQTHNILAQGSGEAGVISSVNIDNGRQDVTLAISDEIGDQEVKYVDLQVPYTIYMDDLNNYAEDVKTAQAINNLTVKMLESKSLSLNEDKSCYMIFGEKKSKQELEDEAKRNPMTINGKPMKEVKALKCLGDHVSNSLEESVHLTVTKRLGIARQAIYEIRAIIEDRRAEGIGGMNLAFEIFHSSVLGMILHNCESWCSIPKKTIKVLDNLFLLFFRTIFRIGIGTPIVNFFWETATVKPKFQILQRKLNFIFHLANHDDGALSKQIFNLQMCHGLPGLVTENKEHLEKINFESAKKLLKWQFKKVVSGYIKNLNKQELLIDSKKYKRVKYETLAKEDFKRK